MVKKLVSLIVFFILCTFGIVLGVVLFGVFNPLVFVYGWIMFAFALYVDSLMIEKK